MSKKILLVADDGIIGVEKFKSSAENEYAVSIPILAVSANAFEEDIKASIDAGMNKHLAKPVSAKILYEKTKEYCK